MAFRSVENDNELMKEGEYEVYVKDCCRSETQSHIPVIKFEFVVRADSGIEQAYKNKHVFKNFFRMKRQVTSRRKRSESMLMRLAFQRVRNLSWMI